MIADAPLAVTASIQDISGKVTAFIAAAKSAAANGLTWAEFGQLLIALIKLVVELLDEVRTLTGEQKKQAVLDAVAMLFDAVADKAIPLPLYPIWIFARPTVRTLILALAAGAVEQLLPLVRAVS
jgi:hypothetical protein